MRTADTAGPCRHKIGPACITCILDSSPYFMGLSLAAKLSLQQALTYARAPRRSVLYAEGDRSEHLYILLSGEIKVYKTLADGRQQIHKLAAIPGDLVACEDLFLEHHFSTAEVISDAAVCYIRKPHLRICMDQHQEIPDTLLHTFARNLNAYIHHVANLGQKTAVERIASYLVFLRETHNARSLDNDVVKDSLTRTELADMLGVTQRTLIRGLKHLESANAISLTREGFLILDLPALVRLSGA